MARLALVLLAVTIQFTVQANALEDYVRGSVVSQRKVERVLPVRVYLYNRTLGIENPNDRFGDMGKVAKLSQDGNEAHWSLFFSGSGGDNNHVTDVLVETVDRAIFEEIELNDPRLAEEAEWRRDETGTQVKPLLSASVPDKYQQEFADLQSACRPLVVCGKEKAHDFQFTLMQYLEFQSARTYLILARFKNADESASWSVLRTMITPGRVHTDLIRSKDDEVITGAKSYEVVPQFTYNAKSFEARSILNLDTLQTPANCKVEPAK